MRFTCSTCGEVHEGIPTFGWHYPLDYLEIPEAEREARVALGTDDCVIDEKWFYVRGCLDIPVEGESERFSWGVWVSLSENSFRQFVQYFDQPERSHIGPFFGWLRSHIWIYPDTLNLKTQVHLRDNGLRPIIELEPTDHPLAVEQREGISLARVAEIYEKVIHGEKQ
jgi:hypothetical protein